MNSKHSKQDIESALRDFANAQLKEAAIALFECLGYRSQKRLDLKPNTGAGFISTFAQDRPFNREQAMVDDWESVDFLFQLTDAEIQTSGQGQLPFESSVKYDGAIIQSYLFFAIKLAKDRYTRTQVSAITRSVNRLFDMPAMLLFLHGDTLTLSIIRHRLHKRDESKDVLEKVTLIKDIRFANPHRAHIEILHDLSIAALFETHHFSNFVQLHDGWQKTLNIAVLNQRFFREIRDWYYWARENAHFPKDAPKDRERKDSISVIRLLTRLIFCWFMKEKGLIPAELLQERALLHILKDFDSQSPNESKFYRAILQNLFFATLSVPMPERQFRTAHRYHGKNKDYMDHRVFRHRLLFRDENALESLFGEIPFLNGGLFECLDYRSDAEGEVRIDGFSDVENKQPVVPDFLFFTAEQPDTGLGIDLNSVYGTKNKKYVLRGLIKILDNYKFTITENTPVEEEIALDPELLGMVFESLLAYYNPETGAAARKQIGAYYTPRQIVDYMVEEALIAHLKDVLATSFPGSKEVEVRLRELFAYKEKSGHSFTEPEVQALVEALDHLKICDPACGSGAFLMGMLHRVVFVLSKLDPDNARWKQKLLERTPAEIRAETAKAIQGKSLDYIRKLGLIQNCIYGVDIQSIAIEISKLRFFISLLVDFHVDRLRKSENYGIEPLPNLDYKLMQGNSLLDEFHGMSLAPDGGGDNTVQRRLALDQERQRLVEILWKRQTEYLLAARPDDKDRLRAQVNDAIVGLFHYEIEERKTPYFAALKALEQKARGLPGEEARRRYYDAGKAKIDQEFRFDFIAAEEDLRVFTYGHKDRSFFPWRLYFADVFLQHGGFDITIGNPPYVRADEQSEENRRQRQAILGSGQYETLWEKWDLFVPFIEKAYKLLRPRGITTMIVSDAYCHSKYAQKSQNWFLRNSRILWLDFFSRIKIFDAAVRNMTYLFQKADGTHNKPERRVHDPEFGVVNALPSDEQVELTCRSFFPEDSIACGFACQTVSLEEICYVSVGMVVHADEKREQGAFQLADLVSHRKDTVHPKPFVEGKHLARWLPATHKWLEWGTDRAPEMFRRPTFP